MSRASITRYSAHYVFLQTGSVRVDTRLSERDEWALDYCMKNFNKVTTKLLLVTKTVDGREKLVWHATEPS